MTSLDPHSTVVAELVAELRARYGEMVARVVEEEGDKLLLVTFVDGDPQGSFYVRLDDIEPDAEPLVRHYFVRSAARALDELAGGAR